MAQSLDVKKLKRQIEELDEGREAGKVKLTQNLTTLKVIITQLETATETDDALRLLAFAHKVKKRIKVFIQSLQEEEQRFTKRLTDLELANKKLNKELKALKEKNRTLEEQNADLKAQVDLLNAFREENIEQNKEQNESEGSDSDENLDTFNADISLDPQVSAENTSKKTDTITPEEPGRARSGSKITIRVEKVKEPSSRTKSGADEETRARGRTRADKGASASVSNPTGAIKQQKRGAGFSVTEPATTTSKESLDSPPSTTTSTTTTSTNTSTTTTTTTGTTRKSPPRSQNQPSQEQAPIFDENTVVDIVTGLEVTIKERNWGNDLELIPKDYTYWYQFKLKRKNRELLKFKDFAPKVFMTMRRHWGVSDEDFLRSFNYENLTAIKGEGKSGAFFIFTKDKQFILKTATDRERDFLWQTLPYYWQYMRRHPNSLLPRFYGVYSMKHEGIGGMIRFVIMNNIFNTPYDPIERFDLKGSTVGRFTDKKKSKPGAILKDLDIKENDRKLYLPHDLRKDFIKQLKLDTEFLAHNNVMDYSLLVGIYYETPENKDKTAQNLKKLAESKTTIPNLYKSKFQQHHNGVKFEREDGVTEIYYVGIIDILIQYMTKKKIEGFVKSIAYAGEEVSVIQPSYYAQRFYNFMKGIISRPSYEEESSSEDSSEPKQIADLPEPGSGDIISLRPAGESVSEKALPEKIVDKRLTVVSGSVSGNSSVSTGERSRDSKKSVVYKEHRQSRVLDKANLSQ